MPSKRPEILAPVGTWEMCLAAVHNGADAIYVGMPGFNARGRAETLSLETLREMITFCHLYGVRVFLAFNILIFQDELDTVSELLKEVLPLAPDALIVQDIGLVRLIKALAPNQVVHASTQMTVTCAEAIECTDDLDIARYVLARELSIEEITKIKTATTKELEVFVHGALCVSYSGQCLTSESIGGRSANRGQCAQSCRLPYELIVDGEKKTLGNARYLVSPKDLCSLDEAPVLRDLGVDSFKIEGRLKSPEYVASTTRAYRAAIDATSAHNLTSDDLQIVYSRDFYSGWMHGVNHQKLVRADFSSHFGLEIGSVLDVDSHTVKLRSSRKLRNGDGLLFFNPAQELRSGSPVYSVTALDSSTYRVELENSFPLNSLEIGSLVFLNSSPTIEKILRSSFTAREHFKTIPLSVEIQGTVGAPLVVKLRDSDGTEVSISSEHKLAAAKSAPLTPERCRSEFSALSATPFHLVDCHIDLRDPVYLSDRDLRKIRQAAVTALLQRRADSFKMKAAALTGTPPIISERASIQAKPRLSVLVRDEQQLEALAGLAVDEVFLDFEHGKEYERAIEFVRSLGMRAGIATTRVLKPQEKGHLKYIERLKPDSVLVRNLGALHYFRGSPFTLVGDFSLNATNALSAAWLFDKGIARLTPSYDLNQEQLLAMITHSPLRHFEITVHQYMPAFHMEHCVFAAFLSNGTSWRDCGRPCEKHRVELRAANGALHPLKADAECRNTMFNGKAQSAARLVPALRAAHVSAFRFEALFESSAELRDKVSAYLDLINGQIDGDELFMRCRSDEKYGVGDGQLLSIRRYHDRKKEGGLERPEQVSKLLAVLDGRP